MSYINTHLECPLPRSQTADFLIKRGDDYLVAFQDHKPIFSMKKEEALLWSIHQVAASWAEAYECCIWKRFSDGFEKKIGPDFTHP